jgi:hypothetical protein
LIPLTNAAKRKRACGNVERSSCADRERASGVASGRAWALYSIGHEHFGTESIDPAPLITPPNSRANVREQRLRRGYLDGIVVYGKLFNWSECCTPIVPVFLDAAITTRAPPLPLRNMLASVRFQRSPLADRRYSAR